MKSDIQIAQEAVMEPIAEVAKRLDIREDELELYGKYKAKFSDELLERLKDEPDGKLVLVTAINPTPAGEGKTTTSVGLGQAFGKLGKKAVIALREPSLGPVFGMKGGATGGGHAQIAPMEDINLHFTGDFHAITAANDLLCAAIDNHIYHGNSLDIQKVVFKRCLDVNDRALRKISLEKRNDSFSITAASEIMALFCLADSIDDLKRRLGNIIIGYNSKNEVVYAKDLHIEGALTVLLKDAFLPNLVQTLEHTPTIIHGGPFANIAHGCNSIIATELGLSLGEYMVTEAGFGADLGAEKFLDIKCRKASISPDCIVLVATIKALKYNAYVDSGHILEENVDAVKAGLANLGRHIENLSKYGIPVVVCLNKFATDSESEIKAVEDFCLKKGTTFSTSTAYTDGGSGAIDLANKVITACSLKSNFKLLYDDNSSISDKIEKVCCEIYRAREIEYSSKALEKIDAIEKIGRSNLPICVAKTQYSFSDDAKKLGAPNDFKVYVRDICLYNGAEFVTVLLGNIMTMPGLPKVPNYEKIDLIDGKIVGLS